jgi:hypothetical protein
MEEKTPMAAHKKTYFRTQTPMAAHKKTYFRTLGGVKDNTVLNYIKITANGEQK